MQPGIPTAAQTFRSSQTEIADPTSVDGGAATSNKEMLLHRREPRNVEKRRKKKKKKVGWKLEESEILRVSGNVLQLSKDPLLYREGGGRRAREREGFRVEDVELRKCGDGRYLIEIKSVHQITRAIRTKRKRIGRSVDDLWEQ